MRKLASLLALALAACGTSKADQMVTVVAEEPERIAVPAECMRADREWQDLPDRDVTQSEAARNYATNRRLYRRMKSDRSVCRAGLKIYAR